MTTIEKRVRWLEDMLLELQGALRSLQHKVGQAAEDGGRQRQDSNAGRILLRAQSVGVISAASGSTLGTGTARLIQVIGPDRYKVRPVADGEVTVDVVNDTGSPTRDKEYLILAVVDGRFTCILGDCATAPGSLAVAPDPPE